MITMLTGHAHAQLILCNRTTADVEALVAVPSSSPFGPADVKGTSTVKPGACQTITNSDISSGAYYYAENEDHHIWGAMDDNDPKNAFCIDTNADNFDRQEWSAEQEKSCPSNQGFVHFKWLDTGNASETVDLTPNTAR